MNYANMTDPAARMAALFNSLCQRPAAAGEVWLVGAGPGDVELLTLKALRVLQQAEVVVYDRLVSEEILALAPPTALRIDVGKTPGRHTLPQPEINALLVTLAQGGSRVVRLKGGDPFIFGRGGEEQAALQQAGIACRVVPGITAALGCAAASGIPLTHRACAQSVRLVTGHGRDGAPDLDWRALVAERQTLVCYMGLTHCDPLAQQLMAHGMAATMPVAVVARGTRADQQVWTCTLATLAETVRRAQPPSPSLLIIGEVVTCYRAPGVASPAQQGVVAG